jgi:hypothetical protein
MSLLDGGQGYVQVTVHPQITKTDPDGNTQTYGDPTGIVTMAKLQIAYQPGTSARRAEQDGEGFSSEDVYLMHFTRAFDREHGELGAQSYLYWGNGLGGNPARWQIFGNAQRFLGSRRTAHTLYAIRRA